MRMNNNNDTYRPGPAINNKAVSALQTGKIAAKVSALIAAIVLSIVASALATQIATAAVKTNPNQIMPKAFVYTELQQSIAFKNLPWRKLNSEIKNQPGLLNKTWLSGVGNHSVGGFYAFDSLENAQKFVTGYFLDRARQLGVAQTSRIFNAQTTEAASRQMNSVHYVGKLQSKPGAYVYTEVQSRVVPFEKGPWPKINPVLKKQKGLLAKTWLSGLHTGSPGGLYAFDTIENARNFATKFFAGSVSKRNLALYTRIFDASTTEAASRDMKSPFYN